MELLQLSYFWVVARLEHMTRAAEELNVTQPSLSRSITRLEREIGVPLFDRHGRGLRLNQLGRVFLGHIDQVARELDSATRQLRDMAGLELGTISLAAGALHWLPEVLRPFIALHPDVRFRLAQRSLPEMTRLLAEAEIDSCFLPGVPLGPRTRWHHLRTAPISLIVPSSHRLAGRTGVELSEVDGEDMILGKPGDVLRETMDDYFRQAGIIPRVACEADEPAAVEDFVAAGFGVAFIPGLSKPTPRHELTASVPIIDPACVLTLGIAWDQDRCLSFAARAFRRHVVSMYEEATPEAAPGG
ncbi:MAG: LysR family transcriptional regulator [Chloroflexia bacterium]|nr:LysR family transcriptional regulator [Chloroflexia bacterium]